MNVYSMAALLVLGFHFLYLLWVIFGALVARRRMLLRRFHIACLLWGVLVEVLPWPCPLTLLESWLEGRGGIDPYSGGFLLHYLDALVYPNISPLLLTVVGLAVCTFNLGIYFYDWTRRLQLRNEKSSGRSSGAELKGKSKSFLSS
jgi:cytochrome c biogenesis protein CcdA